MLRLHFADKYGNRSTDYFVEGEQILDDFDIVTEAGGINLALVMDFAVTVDDGDGMQIEAVGAGDVFEAGIEVLLEIVEEPQPDADGGTQDAGGGDTDDAGGITDHDAGGITDIDAGGITDNDAGGITDNDIELSGGCAGCSAAGRSQKTPLLALFLLIALSIRRRRG